MSGEKSREDEESRTLADTDEARFDRLLNTANADPEALGWVEVVQPDEDLAGIGIGAMVSWECDIYVPDIIQAIAKSGEALGAIGMMQQVLPATTELGFDIEGLPSSEEMSAVAGFIGGLNASLLVVGEDDDTDWRVAGKVTEEFLHGEIEGRARIVGKVNRVIQPSQWKPLMASRA